MKNLVRCLAVVLFVAVVAEAHEEDHAVFMKEEFPEDMPPHDVEPDESESKNRKRVYKDETTPYLLDGPRNPGSRKLVNELMEDHDEYHIQPQASDRKKKYDTFVKDDFFDWKWQWPWAGGERKETAAASETQPKYEAPHHMLQNEFVPPVYMTTGYEKYPKSAYPKKYDANKHGSAYGDKKKQTYDYIKDQKPRASDDYEQHDDDAVERPRRDSSDEEDAKFFADSDEQGDGEDDDYHLDNPEADGSRDHQEYHVPGSEPDEGQGYDDGGDHHGDDGDNDGHHSGGSDDDDDGGHHDDDGGHHDDDGHHDDGGHHDDDDHDPHQEEGAHHDDGGDDDGGGDYDDDSDGDDSNHHPEETEDGGGDYDDDDSHGDDSSHHPEETEDYPEEEQYPEESRQHPEDTQDYEYEEK